GKKYFMIIKDITTLNDTINNFIESNVDNNPVAFDIETDGVNRFGTNIYGFGIAFSPETAIYVVLKDKHGNDIFTQTEKQKLIELVDYIFLHYKIIGHNVVFDLIHWENYSGINYFGHVLADTILMQHLLNEDGPFGLKDIAYNLFGKSAIKEQEELIKNVELNGGKVTKNECEYFKADTQILGDYCIQDVKLTYRIYNLFLRLLVKHDLYDLFEDEVMPLYRLVTMPMNKHGLKVDVNLLRQLQQDIENDINVLVHRVLNKIEPMILPIEHEILQKEIKQTPRGDFGKTYAKYLGLTDLSKKFLKTYVPKNYEEKVFIEFYETGDSSKLPRRLEVMRDLYKERHPNQPRVFNIRSKQHLQKLFFDHLKLKPVSYTDKNTPQVNEEFLESIVNKYDWVRDLITINKLEKIKGTYIDGILERIENGSYIFPSMLQFGTTSGRFSSRNPNCQNLPRPFEDPDKEDPIIVKYNDSIRKVFISEEGYVFVDADYTALEPHCFAHMSSDENLQKIFINREDMYSAIAKRVFNLKDVSSFKSDENFLGKKYPAYRQKIKVVALAAVYGASKFRIAKLLNISEEEAELILTNYFNSYPNLKNYIESCHNSVCKYGYVKTIFGRRRNLLRAKELYDSYGDDLFSPDKIEQKHLFKPAKEFKNLLNNSTNFPIQGLAAHIVNRAMINMTKQFKKNNLDATVVLQIHDQIVVECREEIADKVRQIVKECMENVVKLSVPLNAEPKIAKNLKDSH
ncbi:MAG: DNA polymerase, partial [candidate division WOR-3 bacterium]